jgi:hypothetical protein
MLPLVSENDSAVVLVVTATVASGTGEESAELVYVLAMGHEHHMVEGL